MKINKQKQLILVIFLIGIPFILLNGSFFALCSSDPTLETIKWLSACSWEALKGTGYMFLAYGFANAAYNIHYTGPRLLYSFCVVKWADKINALFGFKTQGELEAYLANAEKTCSPLYLDAKKEVYSICGDIKREISQSVLRPIYDNTFGIFQSYRRNEPVNKPITKNEIMKEIIKETVNVPKYVAALPQERLEALDTLNQNVQKYKESLDKATKLVEVELGEKAKLVRLDFLAPYMDQSYYGDIVRRSPNSPTPHYLLSDLAPNTQINDFVIEEILLIESAVVEAYPSKPDTEFYFKVGGRLKFALRAEARAKELKIKRLRKTNDDGYCYFNIPIREDLLNNTDCICFMEFLKANPEIDTHIKIHKDAANNIYTVTMNSYTNEHAALVLDTFAELKKSATEIQEYANSLTMSYASVATAAATVVLPWEHLATNLTHMNEFINIMQNPEAVRSVVSSLQAAGQMVPDFLQPFVSNPVLPTGQETTPADIVEIKRNIPSNVAPSTYGLNWTTGLGIVAGAGLLFGGIYCYKNGINPFAMSDAASAVTGNDYSKYLNFKKL